MKNILLIFVFLSTIKAFTQENWTHYNVSNTSTQLSYWNVFSVAEDIDGSIWFATTYGVSSFSGTTWTNYTTTDGLIGNTVYSIAIDAQGNKWFGTTDGVSMFDGSTWTNYPDESFYGTVNSITSDAQGNIWFGKNGKGVSKFDGTTWKNYTKMISGLVNNNINSIANDGQDNIWIATDGGVSKFDGSTWINYTTAEGLIHTNVRSVTIDGQDNKWFGTQEGVSKFDGNTWTNYTTADGLADNYVHAIAIDAQGNKWFGTSDGVSMFDGNTWTNYTTADGLIRNSFRSIIIDAQGNKWFGTFGGVSKFDGSTWTNYTSNGLWKNTVYSITNESEALWFTHGYTLNIGGVSKFDGNAWAYYTTADGLPISQVVSIAIDEQGNKWFGTSFKGVAKYNGTSWKYYKTGNGLVDNRVHSIAIDAQGNKWFGTDDGLSKFDDSVWTNYTTTDGLVSNNISVIVIDNEDNKWLGTPEGVSKFDGSNWTNYTTANGLVDNSVNSIAIDALGNKWICTPEGVSKYDGSAWTRYTTANGLVDNRVHSIAIDAQGNKWFATAGGISKFDGSIWISYIDVNELTNDFTSVAVDAKGDKWFGTLKGVTVLEDGGSGPLDLSKVQKGFIFFDKNSNAVWDNNEVKLTNQIIQKDNLYLALHNNGWFYSSVNNGQHSFKYIPNNNWQLTTDSIITITVNDTSTLQPICFGVKPLINESDISVSISGSVTRAGFTSKYWLDITNAGTLTQRGTLTLKLDPNVSSITTIPAASRINDTTIIWDIDSILPYQHRQYQIITQMPGVELLGDTLVTTASFIGDEIETDTLNNYDIIEQVLTGSYDPNDKLVKEGVGENGAVLLNQALTYTIRFQNTGTDTAFNINIRDTMDLNMDISTLTILSSSHSMYFDIKDQNVVTFYFENVLLPDSIVNEPESHGFVKYSIIPKANLAVNTEVRNKAAIYFDFNPPIVTNVVLNTYVDVLPNTTAVISNTEAEEVLVYPNPSSDIVNIKCNLGRDMNFIEILNHDGQVAYKTTEYQERIDISALQKGLYFVKVGFDNGFVIKRIIKD